MVMCNASVFPFWRHFPLGYVSIVFTLLWRPLNNCVFKAGCWMTCVVKFVEYKPRSVCLIVGHVDKSGYLYSTRYPVTLKPPHSNRASQNYTYRWWPLNGRQDFFNPSPRPLLSRLHVTTEKYLSFRYLAFYAGYQHNAIVPVYIVSLHV